MTDEFDLIYLVVFGITIAIAIAMMVIGIIRWKRRTHCPQFTINATVATKRAKARRHSQKTDTGTQIVNDIFCYVTFREANTNILELKVSVSEYMALNKGESGKLTFKGAKFICFEKSTGEIVSDEINSATKEVASEISSEAVSEADGEATKKKKRNKKQKQKAPKPQENSETDSEVNSETASEASSETKGDISDVKNETENEAIDDTEKTSSEANSETNSENVEPISEAK
ncbi:MAG: DUF2500 domain-containing protein [Clostridiales bacterium]|nr:DUF2500 domain-containing protein [Clostridiales bacterium]